MKNEKDILNDNVLNLHETGLEIFPGEKIGVASFVVDNEDPRGHIPLVTIIALIDKDNQNPTNEYSFAHCFLVEDGSTYYFRIHLDECLDLVQAIRKKNNYSADYGKF